MNIAIIGSTEGYDKLDYENAILAITPLVESSIKSLDKKITPTFIFCGSPLSDCMTLDIASRLYEQPKIQYHLICNSVVTLKNINIISNNDVAPLVSPGKNIMEQYNKLPYEQRSYFLSLYDTYGFSESNVYKDYIHRNNEVANLSNLLICVTVMSHIDFFDTSVDKDSNTKYIFSKCKGAKYHYSLVDKTIESSNPSSCCIS